MGALVRNNRTGEYGYRQDSGDIVPAEVARNRNTGEMGWRPKGSNDPWQSVGAIQYQPQSNRADPLPDGQGPYQPPGVAETAQRSLLQGGTFGLGDEIVAGAAATLDPLKGMFGGNELGGDWSQRYQVYLDRERGRLRQGREENPGTAITSEIGGAIANPATIMSGPFVAGSKGAGILGQTLRGGAVGAGEGALYGFGSGEGDFQRRLGNSAIEGGIGMVGGSAMPSIVRSVGSAGTAFWQKALDASNGQVDKATQMFSNMVARVGDGDIDVGIRRIQQGLDQGGADTAIVDVVPTSTQRTVRGAIATGGQAQDAAEKFIRTRSAGRGGRLADITEAISSGTYYPSLEALGQARSASARPLYERAWEIGRGKWSEALGRIMKDPDVVDAMNQQIRNERRIAGIRGEAFDPQSFAITQFDEAGDPIIEAVPTLRSMDAAKRGLDSRIGALLDEYGRVLPGQGDEYNILREIRTSLVSELDRLTTDPDTGESVYAAARAAWAGPSAQMDAMNRGRRFLRNDPEITESAIKNMNDGDKAAFLIGARRALLDMISSDTQSAIGRMAEKKEGLWGRLRSLFDNEEAFNRFQSSVMVEADKARVDRMMNLQAGSPTTPMREDVAQFSRMSPAMQEVTSNFFPGGQFSPIGGALRTAAMPIRAGIDKIAAPDQQTAGRLAEIMLDLNRTRQQQSLGRLNQRIMAPRFGAGPLSQALMGSAGTVSAAQGE
jgi:hypothetical protein